MFRVDVREVPCVYRGRRRDRGRLSGSSGRSGSRSGWSGWSSWSSVSGFRRGSRGFRLRHCEPIIALRDRRVPFGYGRGHRGSLYVVCHSYSFILVITSEYAEALLRHSMMYSTWLRGAAMALLSSSVLRASSSSKTRRVSVSCVHSFRDSSGVVAIECGCCILDYGLELLL